MAELGVGWISVRPSMKGFNSDISSALKGVDPVAEKSGKSMGSRISSGIGTTLKRSVVGVGAAAGAGLAVSLTKGLGRLSGIENAEAKLAGLGHEAGSVSNIMDDALVSVKGTSFGLEDAATVAASAVAAGIKPGEDLQRTLKLTGDAATIAGIDISSMGSIVNKVATSNSMQMDVANQLMDAGIPILQMVATELGVTADEARKMASDGEISFEIFQSALEQGVSGAALEAGNTVQGSFANMGAAAGRLGATLAGPFFDQAAGAFGGVTDLLDGMNAKAGPVMDQFAKWLTGTGIPALKDFGSSALEAFDNLRSSSTVVGLLDRTKSAFSGLFSAGRELAPTLVNIGEALGKASAALGVSGWQLFLTTLEGVGAVAEALTPPLEAVSNFMSDHPAIVTAAVGAWVGFKTIPGIMTHLGGAITRVKDATAPAFANMRDFGSTVGEAYGYARQANPEMGRFGAALQVVGGKGGVASVALDGVRGAVGGVMDIFGGPWGLAMVGAGAAVAAVADASSRASRANEALAGQSRETAEAQQELRSALAETNGELGEQGIAAAARLAKAELTEFTAVGQQMDGLISKTHDLSDTFSMTAGEVREQQKEMRAAGDAYSTLQDVSEELGMSQDDVNRAVAEGGHHFNMLISRLRDSGDAGGHAADELMGVRESIQQSIEKIKELDPEVASASATFADLADNTDDAAGGADRLRVAFMELRGVNMSADEAAAELTKEISSLTGNMEGLEGATLKTNGTIDTTTDSGVALFDAMNELGSAMQRSVGSGNDANAVFGQSAEQLEAMRVAAGMGEEEWQALLDTMGMTPEQMEIVAEIQGDQAKMELAGLAEQVSDFTTGPYSTKISIQDEEARARLEGMGFQLLNFDEASGTADLHVNDQASVDKLNWWIAEGFPAIDFANPTAEANLNVDGLMFNKDYAKFQLDNLDLERPNPLASMDISMLHASQIDALNQVGLLDGQTPTPLADMNIGQLSAEQQTALAQVFDLAGQTPTPVADLTTDALHSKKNAAKAQTDDLNRQRPEPVADLNTDGVRTGVNDSNSWISSIRDRTVSVVFRAVYEGFTSGFGGAGGSSEFHTGGRVPAYAVGSRHAGYRLPRTGPGTDRVDGFTAFNSDMVPAARLDAGEWVINGRSSDRYDRELAEINRGTFPKLPGYRDGGRAHADEIDSFVRGNSVRGHRAKQPLEGAPYLWAGINWGDCSAAMAAIARFTVGLAPFAARFATGNQREALSSMGFTMGKGPEGTLRMGWKNGGPGGGHTSGTLPNGVNVEMGGGRGNGQYGGNAAGAHHSQYTDHAYLRVPTSYAVAGIEGDGFDVPSDRTYGTATANSGDFSEIPASNRRAITGGGATRSVAPSPSGSAADKGPTSWSEVAGIAGSEFASGQVKDILGVFGIPDSPPALQAYRQWEQDQAEMRNMASEPIPDSQETTTQELPTVQRAVSDAVQTVASQPPPNLDMPTSINRTVKVAYDPTGGAAQWKPVVEMALGKLGASLGHTSRTIDQIDIESGGDPNAQNNWDSNAAAGDPSIGLLQVIGSTFRAYRAQDLPNDQRHPLANIYAAGNYAQDRYGSLDKIWPTRAGYWTGGWVNGVGNAVADAIPAALSNGEFVVRASRAAQYGPLLEQINGDRPTTATPKRHRDGDIHIHGADASEVMRRLAARQKKESMQFTGG